MYDLIVAGKGPAGISAAIYGVRAGLRVLVLGMDDSALLRAHTIENYYGFPNGISGKDLFEAGIAQAKELGVEVKTEEVVGLGFTEALTVTTNVESYQAYGVVLALGASRKTPNLAGIKELEGKGVSYCAVCDGFFYRQKDVGGLGNGEYALHEAQALLPLASSVTIFTNGRPMTVPVAEGIAVEERPLAAVRGTESVEAVELADGTKVALAGLFVAEGVAGVVDLAKKIGAETTGAQIVVDERMQTNVPGLFACGDCVPGLYQVAKAVHDGAIAGLEAGKWVRSQKEA